MRGDRGRSAAKAILALHRRLLPADPRISWTPYLWLFWLINFFFKWFIVPPEPVELGLAMLTLPVFLVLYFDGFWHSGRRVLVDMAGILLIGLAWTPFNTGAMSFFVYAGAFAGRADRPPRAYAWLAVIVLLIAVEWLVLDLANFVPLLGGAFTALIGAASIHSAELDRRTAALQLSQAEIRRLASVAERERIGRDLHDLLGHTLSLIVIKAQFAAKLASRGDCRAEQEIREVEGISRDALREVREVVTGFRRSDLDAELANARLACEAAGIRLTVDRAFLDLSPDREAVLAMCLREAVTNVVRHAGADQCRASLAGEGRWIRLTVADDGRGGVICEGAGLTGMRERVERAGGEMAIDTAGGVTVTVRVPVDRSGQTESPWYADPAMSSELPGDPAPPSPEDGQARAAIAGYQIEAVPVVVHQRIDHMHAFTAGLARAVPLSPLRSICRRVSELTTRRDVRPSPGVVVARLNRVLTGWANYFTLGQVSPAYVAIDRHATRRLRQWLGRKHKVRTGKLRRFPGDRLWSEYGLTHLAPRTASLPWAKA